LVMLQRSHGVPLGSSNAINPSAAHSTANIPVQTGVTAGDELPADPAVL